MGCPAFEKSFAAIMAPPRARSRWMSFVSGGQGCPLDSNEQISLRAMILYVAHVTRQAEFKVERDLSDMFEVPNIHYLPADEYDRAFQILSDQVSSSI